VVWPCGDNGVGKTLAIELASWLQGAGEKAWPSLSRLPASSAAILARLPIESEVRQTRMAGIQTVFEIN
jgi:hypothetical protein